jgi:hypothetical protein
VNSLKSGKEMILGSCAESRKPATLFCNADYESVSLGTLPHLRERGDFTCHLLSFD